MSNDSVRHTFLVTVKNADALLRTLGARVEGKKRFREICFGCSRAASAKAPHSGEWGRDRLFSAAHSSTNLGDLMRLSVRPGVQIKYATVVSRTDESAPKQTKTIHLSQDSNPISGQSDSRVSVLVKKKRKLSSGLPPTLTALLVLPLNIHVLVLEY